MSRAVEVLQGRESSSSTDPSSDVVEAVLAEAGKFATDIIAPLNAVGDRHGTP
jgi:hypothetical protein